MIRFPNTLIKNRFSITESPYQSVFFSHLLWGWGIPCMPYLLPGREAPGARPNGERSCETVAVAIVAVTWRLGLTLRPGNYIWRFSYAFRLLGRDLGEWRLGFYTEFRCASRQHSGLACGAFFYVKILENVYFLKIDMSNKSRNRDCCPGQQPRGSL